MGTLLINCDLGENESPELTELLMESLDAANICCGWHAGSLEKTAWTLKLAHAKGRMIGAHPGLPTEGGRGDANLSVEAFRSLLLEQLESFLSSAAKVGATADYVKLHGSLYHLVERQPAYAECYVQCLIEDFGSKLGLFTLSGGQVARLASKSGLRIYHEVFADRAYAVDGQLVPRRNAGSVLSHSEVIARFEAWMKSGMMPTVEGLGILLRADTLCVHGDSAGALEMICKIRLILNNQ